MQGRVGLIDGYFGSDTEVGLAQPAPGADDRLAAVIEVRVEQRAAPSFARLGRGARDHRLDKPRAGELPAERAGREPALRLQDAVAVDRKELAALADRGSRQVGEKLAAIGAPRRAHFSVQLGGERIGADLAQRVLDSVVGPVAKGAKQGG